MRTVDLVVAGDSGAACAAAAGALRQGLRVLVVLRSADVGVARRVRSHLRTTAHAVGRLTVVTNAEVVCVDGVDAVEAVVIRHSRTGRLSAVNASVFASCRDD